MPAFLAGPLAATAHESTRHPARGPYILGAVVISILAIALMVQLIVRMKRARRR